MSKQGPIVKSHLKSSTANMSTLTNKKQAVVSIDDQFLPEYRQTGNPVGAQFNITKLRKMLKQYTEYPEKYRMLTWQFLLELPLRKELYESLLNKGVHPAFRHLHKRFPLQSYRLYNKLVRLLSCLGHWCPIFHEVEYLPALMFPILKATSTDDLMAFEVAVSLLHNWMTTWFEVYPAEPTNVTLNVQRILDVEDP